LRVAIGGSETEQRAIELLGVGEELVAIEASVGVSAGDSAYAANGQLASDQLAHYFLKLRTVHHAPLSSLLDSLLNFLARSILEPSIS
jgi:hypothetical protein